MSRRLPPGKFLKALAVVVRWINELPGYQRLLAAGGRFLVDL